MQAEAEWEDIASGHMISVYAYTHVLKCYAGHSLVHISEAFGWYGVWVGGGFRRWARCSRTSCTAPRTALIISIYLNHSLNQFIKKQWFIQEWNTTAVLLWNMHGCEDTWRGHSHLTVVHNDTNTASWCSTGTTSLNMDCYRISSH